MPEISMAIIVEDGTIVANADSYVSVADYEAWADARGIEYDSSVIESQILRAMDYIETLRFIGQKSTKAQQLQFPRVGVVVDGFELDYNEIPQQLKKAVFESVKAESEGLSQLANIERRTLREKVGEIEVQYAENSNSQTSVVAINKALYKLLAPAFLVSRA
jgi:hypothetical protein